MRTIRIGRLEKFRCGNISKTKEQPIYMLHTGLYWFIARPRDLLAVHVYIGSIRSLQTDSSPPAGNTLQSVQKLWEYQSELVEALLQTVFFKFVRANVVPLSVGMR